MPLKDENLAQWSMSFEKSAPQLFVANVLFTLSTISLFNRAIVISRPKAAIVQGKCSGDDQGMHSSALHFWKSPAKRSCAEVSTSQADMCLGEHLSLISAASHPSQCVMMGVAAAGTLEAHMLPQTKPRARSSSSMRTVTPQSSSLDVARNTRWLPLKLCPTRRKLQAGRPTPYSVTPAYLALATTG